MGIRYRTQRYWQLLKSYATFHGYLPSPLTEQYEHKVWSPKAGNKIIAERIREGRPFCAGKIGHNERAILLESFRSTIYNEADKWAGLHASGIHLNSAGIFPYTNKIFEQFVSEYRKALTEMDLLALMGAKSEEHVVRSYSPKSKLTGGIRAMEPYYHSRPWSRELKGEKVLVITSFSKTIEAQYAKRELIWKDKNILPEFTLKTIKLPLNAHLQKPEHRDWQEALDDIKQLVKDIDFDIALIGAGAWSLPLCTHIKSLGQSAIHTGGATQILFGIKGGRWEQHPVISKYYNSSWCRVQPEELPDTEQETIVPNADKYW